jgi:hypothetical protein
MFLEESAEHISAQLEFADPQEYPDDESFFGWKGRAVSALSHVRAEIKFIERWIGIQEFESKFRDLQTQGAPLFQLGTIVRRLSAEMVSRYQPVYGTDVPPPNYDEALARRDELNDIGQRFHGFFQGFKLLVELAGITEAEGKKLIQPMVIISQRMAQEVNFLRKYLRTYVSGSNRIQALLDIVDRVTQEQQTLTLTQIEKTIVEEARSFLASRDG